MDNNNQQMLSEKEMLTVGLGASAGGLDALKEFFGSLPAETGMTFVVIMHLAPDHDSNLAELLQSQTSLNVVQVTDDVEMKSDQVYVIPPGKLLKAHENRLELSETEKEHGLASIDLFFRSLAKAKAGRGACIILSGSGNDGATGMKAVKEAGGLTIVQEPEDAQYPGMPQSAINSGLPDIVCPVKKMADELMSYQQSLTNIHVDKDEADEELLQNIFSLVQSHTGHDFSSYKRSSVLRRIERRMQVNRTDTLADYLTFLQNYPKESKDLFKDLLISVTSFFRDKEAFEKLEETIIPKLFEGKSRDDQLRVWVPGCATGEEAYSIAILLLEYARSLDILPEIKVFASDIDEAALDLARVGFYPRSITADVSSRRLHHHFKKEGPQYRIKKELREMVLFASHDLLRDPPFSKQDLITCRNLLIYLNSDLQSEVFNLFHYTLRPEGYLFMGLSDSHLQATQLFSPVDKKMGLFRRITVNTSNTRLPRLPLRFNKSDISATNQETRFARRASNFETMHRNLLNSLYAPESVIVNESYEVLHATDNIQRYLQYSGGQPSLNVLEMVRPEMRQPLRSLLFDAEKKKTGPLRKQIKLTDKSGRDQVEVIVHRINETNFSNKLLQVVFKDVQRPPEESKEVEDTDGRTVADAEEDNLISSLEEELEYTKEQLQITVEEYETSNEELRASNEELQSMNEELQSTTEELETSQEELQSLNEELTTVNQQLENEVEKLDQAKNDLKNLMEATKVGIIFVDNDFCVQRFTSVSTEIFNLIEPDIGRPIAHVTHKLHYDNLVEDIRKVHDELTKIKKAVHTDDGRWFIMRLRPYRSIENKIEGVVLTFVEYTELKEAREIAEDKPKQEALAELGIYALEHRDLESIMKRAIDLSCIILHLDCAVIYALNEENGTLEIGAQAGCASEIEPVDINEEWDIGYAVNNQEPILVDNYEEEKRFGISPFLKDEGVLSSLNVKVRGSDDTYGLFGFYSREQRDFSESEVHFVQVIANMVGMAIQNKYGRDQLEKEVQRSQAYQREILDNSLTERWELGSYLHDNLAQKLVAIKMLLNESEPDFDAAGDLALLHRIINESIEGIRNLMHDILPIDIEEGGVMYALKFLMQQSPKLYDINCRLEADEVVDEITERKKAANLYFIAQEAIKNAVMHGKAKNIQVKVARQDENIVLSIGDDGTGLSHDTEDANGKGLRIMKHRVELMGGRFEIKSRKETGNQKGTIVRCVIPYGKLVSEEE